MKNDPRLEIFIKEFINVNEPNQPKTTWTKLWGTLTGCTLTFSESPKSDKPKTVIEVKNVELQPAVKETEKLLAFKLVSKGKTLVSLEPLNITDMGRWVSSLFAAIQGVAHYELKDPKKPVDKKKATEWNEVISKQEVGVEKHLLYNKDDENVLYNVKVKDIAKIYENLSSTKEAPKSGATVRRSLSSPNLSTKPASSNKEFTVEVELISKPESKPTVKPPDNVANFEKTTKKVEKTAINKDGYMTIEEEKLMLATLANPQLAKQKIVKHQQTIERLSVTMKSVIEKIKRQKQSLEETDMAIKELESQSTTPEDFDDVAKLRNQKVKLQNNINQSEVSIEEYRELISKTEEEMKRLSELSTSNEKSRDIVARENQLKKTEQATYIVTEHIQLSFNKSENQEQSVKSPLIEQEQNLKPDEPEWILKARRKSEAIKRLTQEGMLN